VRRLAERGYAALGVIYYEQGIIQALRAARGADALKPGSSDIVSTVTQLAILVVLLVILTVRHRRFRPLLRPLLPALVIVLLCIASTAWSDNPVQTLRRSMTLGGCTLFGTYLLMTFGMRGAVTLAGQCAVFLGGLSLLTFIAVPSIGRETALGYERAMRGVFSQKNPMAECMLLGLTCFCYRLLTEGIRLRHLAALALLLLCIALGRSATSLAVAALVLFATAWLGTARHPRSRLVLAFGALWTTLAVVTIGLIGPELVFHAVGRDASLTGRGPLWHEVLRVIAKRPLLGHGYAGFWNEDSREVQYLWLKIGWQAPDAHDGYLDVAVELGLVGLLLYALMWGRVMFGALAALRARTLPEAPWAVLFMLANLVLNLDEGPMPYANGFSLLMPATLVTVSLWLQRRTLLAAQRRVRPARRLVPVAP
jgi:O-antigen ligase